MSEPRRDRAVARQWRVSAEGVASVEVMAECKRKSQASNSCSLPCVKGGGSAQAEPEGLCCWSHDKRQFQANLQSKPSMGNPSVSLRLTTTFAQGSHGNAASLSFLIMPQHSALTALVVLKFFFYFRHHCTWTNIHGLTYLEKRVHCRSSFAAFYRTQMRPSYTGKSTHNLL